MIYKSYTVLLRLSNRVEETYFLREIFQRTVARWSERQKHATRVPFLVSESYWRGSNHPGRSESVHHCSTPTSSIVRPFLRWPIGPQDLVLSNHSHLGRRPRYHFFFLLHPFELWCPRMLWLSGMPFSLSFNPFLSFYCITIRWKFEKQDPFLIIFELFIRKKKLAGKNSKDLSILNIFFNLFFFIKYSILRRIFNIMERK